MFEYFPWASESEELQNLSEFYAFWVRCQRLPTDPFLDYVSWEVTTDHSLYRFYRCLRNSRQEIRSDWEAMETPIRKGFCCKKPSDSISINLRHSCLNSTLFSILSCPSWLQLWKGLCLKFWEEKDKFNYCPSFTISSSSLIPPSPTSDRRKGLSSGVEKKIGLETPFEKLRLTLSQRKQFLRMV